MALPRLLAVNTKESKIREYPLFEDEITVGSDKGNGLVISHGTVSRRHAIIRRSADRFELSDLNSTNGTFVNEHRIYGPVSIKDRDQLRFGAIRFVFLDPGVLGRPTPNPRTTKLRTRVRRMAEPVVILFLVGFGLTEYFLNADRITRLTGYLTTGSTSTPITQASPRRAARTPVAALTSSAATESRAKTLPSPKTVPAPLAEVSSAKPIDATGPVWLTRLNYYRHLAKLPAVSENEALSDGDRKHARYLVKNRVPPDGRAHSEDPANSWFTLEGLAAARAGDLIPPCLGCNPLSPRQAIDLWVSGPFHRVLILNPVLKQVGYGEYSEAGLKAHALNLGVSPSPGPFGTAIAFPGNETVVLLRQFEKEWPDPIASCPGFTIPTGLPITLELGVDVPTKLGNHSLTANGEEVQHCIFDASSYRNSDAAQEDWGKNTLKAFGVVVIIPRKPLKRGTHYTVTVTANGREYRWSFSTGS